MSKKAKKKIVIGVAAPTIRTWVIRYNKSTSFKVDDNRTKEEKELIRLFYGNSQGYKDTISNIGHQLTSN